MLPGCTDTAAVGMSKQQALLDHEKKKNDSSRGGKLLFETVGEASVHQKAARASIKSCAVPGVWRRKEKRKFSLLQ